MAVVTKMRRKNPNMIIIRTVIKDNSLLMLDISPLILNQNKQSSTIDKLIKKRRTQMKMSIQVSLFC